MRHIASLFASVSLCLSLTACAFTKAATPEGAQRILARAAAYHGGSKSLGASKDTRIPLKRGQWVASLTRAKNEPNSVTLQILKIADVAGGTVTFEMEQYSSAEPEKRLVIQQRLRNFPTAPKVVYRDTDASAIRDVTIESVKILGEDGSVQEVPQLGIPIGRIGVDLLRSNVATGEVRSESCQSSEIKASRCYVIPFLAKTFLVSERGTSYAHSDIPVLGVIKTEGEKNDTTAIGYGTSGAQIVMR